MRRARRQETAFQEALQFVFEAYFLVGSPQKASRGESHPKENARKEPRTFRQHVRPAGDVSAEEFVGALTAQCYRRFRLAQFGQKPYRQRACISAWFIGIVGEFFDRALQVDFGGQVQFLVVGSILFYRAINEFRFIETSPSKRN